MIGDKRFLRSIRLRNLLSFGPDTPEFELKSLNVLIGPNGSGKSNLIEAISLLQAAPTNLLDPIRAGGGIAEWLWKGAEPPVAAIEAKVVFPPGDLPLRHVLTLTVVGQRAELLEESIDKEISYFYRNGAVNPVLSMMKDGQRTGKILRAEDIGDKSVLSEYRDPDQYPELTYLGREYAQIKLFRDWQLGRNTPPRRPQQPDLPADFLEDDAANLALILNNLDRQPDLRDRFVEHLKEADESITDFKTIVSGGTIQLFLRYSGLKSLIPATRLSDGTIRWLCLLAVLCHPDPPPLVCLEEPELGLHPDLLAKLAELLIEASHRMQLIVTTHSDTLVDGLTKVPESVVICEKHNGSTTLTRRTGEELGVWLKDYGLGQLWRSGEIGGNRW
jgi:predicted ATPase